MDDTGGRRRGLRLTKEKKALLKKIIMEKAKEEMIKEALEKKEAKDRKISDKVKELPTLEGMDKDDLEDLCRSLQKRIVVAEGEKYDLEFTTHQREEEINELHMKIQMKGKFLKPVLRRVKKYDSSKTRVMREKSGFKDFSEVLTNHIEPNLEV